MSLSIIKFKLNFSWTFIGYNVWYGLQLAWVIYILFKENMQKLEKLEWLKIHKKLMSKNIKSSKNRNIQKMEILRYKWVNFKTSKYTNMWHIHSSCISLIFLSRPHVSSMWSNQKSGFNQVFFAMDPFIPVIFLYNTVKAYFQFLPIIILNEN